MSVPHTLTRAARLRTADCALEDFVALVEQTTDPADFPLRRPRSSTGCWSTTPTGCGPSTSRATGADTVAAELVRALTDGPGVVAFSGAFADHEVVDRATAAFDAIIADEQAAGGGARRPLRQGRRERPDLERAGEAGRPRPRDLRRLLRQRHHRAGLARPGSARATR